VVQHPVLLMVGQQVFRYSLPRSPSSLQHQRPWGMPLGKFLKARCTAALRLRFHCLVSDGGAALHAAHVLLHCIGRRRWWCAHQ